jgi:hypothetical protein
LKGRVKFFRTDGRTYDICDSAAANIDDKDNTSSNQQNRCGSSSQTRAFQSLTKLNFNVDGKVDGKSRIGIQGAGLTPDEVVQQHSNAPIFPILGW